MTKSTSQCGDCQVIEVSVNEVEDIPCYELVDGQLRPTTLTEGERYGVRAAVAMERERRANGRDRA